MITSTDYKNLSSYIDKAIDLHYERRGVVTGLKIASGILAQYKDHTELMQALLDYDEGSKKE